MGFFFDESRGQLPSVVIQVSKFVFQYNQVYYIESMLLIPLLSATGFVGQGGFVSSITYTVGHVYFGPQGTEFQRQPR